MIIMTILSVCIVNINNQECASPGCGCGLINSAVYQKMITIADKQAERDRYS